MTTPPLPGPSLQAVNQSGLFSGPWYEFLRFVSRRAITPVAPSYTKAQLQGGAAVFTATANPSAIVVCSDEAGGAVLAFSDGTNWRRVTDRAVIS